MDRSWSAYAKQLERSKDWKKRNPDRHAELAKAYRLRNKEKMSAQNKLNYAIRKGEIVRQPCEKCGVDKKIHAHHADYAKPLEVRWLCYFFHRQEHGVGDEEKAVKFEKSKKAVLPGETNPNAALTNEEAREIRKMLEAKISQAKIGKLYGVSQFAISQIHLGRTYKEA